ncbi:hypothetical protein SARC_02357 [Sphaeroforma arctica JP610]|uniref:SAP domain-containing protein n=1 Tax=Sphaeroforma arctica JP610 TaxID=667725 RepID=A0A0L0G986_9EUKA|nr:hypothetical protein SARC_02357 [Sphaeroforma arctica JP610]KNC85451.1 hypothetical protein SARC_02357 [Sphaeroforma arctica JP610]|eukprot:XP_014159353.1 hypothetical protein SARC_02357 [Sphaeroforma arctica JP610]
MMSLRMSTCELLCSACTRAIGSREPVLHIKAGDGARQYCFHHIICPLDALFNTAGYRELPEAAQLFLREWASSNFARVRRKDWEVYFPSELTIAADAPEAENKKNSENAHDAEGEEMKSTEAMEFTSPQKVETGQQACKRLKVVTGSIVDLLTVSGTTTFGLRWSTENRKNSSDSAAGSIDVRTEVANSNSDVFDIEQKMEAEHIQSTTAKELDTATRRWASPNIKERASICTPPANDLNTTTQDASKAVRGTSGEGDVATTAQTEEDRAGKEQQRTSTVSNDSLAVLTTDSVEPAGVSGVRGENSVSPSTNHASLLSNVAFQGSQTFECKFSADTAPVSAGNQGTARSPSRTTHGTLAVDACCCSGTGALCSVYSSKRNTQPCEAMVADSTESSKAPAGMGSSSGGNMYGSAITAFDSSMQAVENLPAIAKPVSANELELSGHSDAHFLTASERAKVYEPPYSEGNSGQYGIGTTPAYPYGSEIAVCGTTSAYTASCYKAAHQPGDAENITRRLSTQPYGTASSHLCYDYVYQPLSAKALQIGQQYEPIVATKLWQLSQQAQNRRRQHEVTQPPTSIPPQAISSYPSKTEYYKHFHPGIYSPIQCVGNPSWMPTPTVINPASTAGQVAPQEQVNRYIMNQPSGQTQLALSTSRRYTDGNGSESEVSINTPSTSDLLPSGVGWREYALSEDISRDSVYTIKKVLRRLGLVTTGNKASLLHRIKKEAQSERAFPERMRVRHFQRRRAESAAESEAGAVKETVLQELRDGNLQAKRLDQLKGLCRQLRICVGGTKAEIISRLQRYGEEDDARALEAVWDTEHTQVHT